MKIGMAAEATCVSKPWAVIPMVVTGVQDFIAAGQFRGGEQLIDAQQVSRPGTILVFLEPLYDGGLDGVIPGSSCIVNAYSSNHELLASSPDMSTTRRLVLHGVDAVGLVHALLLRIQALVLPIQTSSSPDIRTPSGRHRTARRRSVVRRLSALSGSSVAVLIGAKELVSDRSQDCHAREHVDCRGSAIHPDQKANSAKAERQATVERDDDSAPRGSSRTATRGDFEGARRATEGHRRRARAAPPAARSRRARAELHLGPAPADRPHRSVPAHALGAARQLARDHGLGREVAGRGSAARRPRCRRRRDGGCRGISRLSRAETLRPAARADRGTMPAARRVWRGGFRTGL